MTSVFSGLMALAYLALERNLIGTVIVLVGAVLLGLPVFYLLLRREVADEDA
jgi:hypothetical protein